MEIKNAVLLAIAVTMIIAAPLGSWLQIGLGVCVALEAICVVLELVYMRTVVGTLTGHLQEMHRLIQELKQ